MIMVESLLERFLAGRPHKTKLAYRRDLSEFARCFHARSPEAAIDGLLRLPARQARTDVLNWIDSMLEEGSSRATVNRRLSVLKSLVRKARKEGLVDWELDVEKLKEEP